MRLTNYAKDKLANLIGTTIVLSIVLLIIALVGWVEVSL